MNIEEILKMDLKQLEERYSKLNGIDWREKAVIKGLHRDRSKEKNLLYKELKEVKDDI